MAAEGVVLPMPISPVASRSSPSASPSVDHLRPGFERLHGLLAAHRRAAGDIARAVAILRTSRPG